VDFPGGRLSFTGRYREVIPAEERSEVRVLVVERDSAANPTRKHQNEFA